MYKKDYQVSSLPQALHKDVHPEPITQMNL